MPITGAREPIVPGVAKEMHRDITGIPAGQTLTKVWLVAKEYYSDDDLAALFIKAIDTDDVPGVGQITDTGAGDTIGHVRFDIDPDDSINFVPLLEAPYAIMVETSPGDTHRYLFEEGVFVPSDSVFSSIVLPEPGP